MIFSNSRPTRPLAHLGLDLDLPSLVLLRCLPAGSIPVRSAGRQDVQRGARTGTGAGRYPNDRGRGEAGALGVPRELPLDVVVDAGPREGEVVSFDFNMARPISLLYH